MSHSIDFVRLFLLRKSINIIKYLPFNNELSFTPLAKELNSAKNMELIYSFIKKIHILHCNTVPYKKEIRIFMSCFMIKQHPAVILSDQSELELEIKKCSDDLLDIFNKILIDNKCNFVLKMHTYKFMKRFNEFVIKFQDWKETDKKKIINDLCQVYFELESDINSRNEILMDNKLEPYQKTNHRNVIRNLEKEQNNIKNKIVQIDGENGIIHLNKLRDQMNSHKLTVEKLYKNINDNLHDAFWDNVKSELSKEPPNFITIIPLLEDAKGMIFSCIPNRHDIHQEIEPHIDIEFIKSMIENNAIDNNYIKNMVFYLISFIKKFQSKSDDKETAKWEKQIIELFQKGFTYSDFFPKFFKELFSKLEKIIKESQFVRNSELFEQIKEAKELRKTQ